MAQKPESTKPESAPVAEKPKVVSEEVHKDVATVANIVGIDKQAQESTHVHHKRMIKTRCPLCEIRYPFDFPPSDVSTLKKFMSVRGNIIARTKSGMCAKHQRALRRAIGQARHLALLPYVDIGA